MKAPPKRTVLILMTVLVVSLIIHYVAWLKVKSLYRETQSLRLYPSGSRGGMRAQHVCSDSAECKSVLLLGDSRIAKWNPVPRIPGSCWLNAGMPGATTAQLLLRAESYLSDSDAWLVVLQIGINDLKAIGAFPDQRDSIVSNCISNTKRIVELVEKQDAHILLMGIVKPGKPELLRRWAWSGAITESVDCVNSQLAELASGRIRYVDVNPYLTETGYIDKYYTEGCLHLNHIAYELINQHLDGVLQEILADLP